MNEFTSISNSIPKEFSFRTIDKKLKIEDFGINVDDPKKARKTIESSMQAHKQRALSRRKGVQ